MVRVMGEPGGWPCGAARWVGGWGLCTKACGVNGPSTRLIFWCFMRGGPRCLLAYGRGWLQVAGGVGSPIPDVPSSGAENKHNGQPVAEPGEGAEEICGTGCAPAMAHG